MQSETSYLREKERRRLWARKWRAANPEADRAKRLTWRAANPDKEQGYKETAKSKRRANPAGTILYHAKARSKRHGLAYDLDLQDIYVPKTCPVLGLPLVVNAGTIRDNSPTLDRISPSKGYVKGNVVVVSHRANRLKNDATLAELEAIVNFYRWLLPAKGTVH